MKAAFKLPGKEWVWIDIVPSLKSLQEKIGGNLEKAPNHYTDAIIFCDEDGASKELIPNVEIYTDDENDNLLVCIVGPMLMFGPAVQGMETDLTQELFDQTIKCMEELWMKL